MNRPLAVLFLVLGTVLALATAPFAHAQPKAADVSGTWDFVVETPQGSGTPVFIFKQDGTKLTGTYKGQFGEAPVSGSVKGNAVTFSVIVNTGEKVKIDYSGTVDGASMKGTARFGSEGDASFTATKRAAK